MQQRLDELEQENIEQQTLLDEHESELTQLQIDLSSVQGLVNLLNELLSFMPNRFQTQMLCGYMELNDLSSFEHWGLNCTIDVNSCTCAAAEIIEP
jgi:hypothetical protein